MGCVPAQNVEFYDVIQKGTVKETKADIVQAMYFNGYGRCSPIDFLLNHASINYERKQIHPVKFFGGSGKKTFGLLPVITRSDGSYMYETVPVARYISRVHGYYPISPRESFKCDQLIEKYQKIINVMDLSVFMFGSAAKARVKLNCEDILPNYFKVIEEDCKEGWLIGDGTKIYMCDFFVGSIYADLILNPTSWMPKNYKDSIKKSCPHYVAYGERFVAENKKWMSNREKQFDGPQY